MAKKNKKRSKPEEDEDEDIDDEDLEEDEDEDEKPKKKSKSKKKDEDEDDEDDEDEDEEDVDDEDDEEEEERPKKKKGANKTKAGKRKEKSDDTEEDDDDDVEEEEDEDDDDDGEEDDEPKRTKGVKSWFSNDEKDATSGGKNTFEPDKEYTVEFLDNEPFVIKQHYIKGAKPSPYLTCWGEDCPIDKTGNRPGGRIICWVLINKKPALISEGAIFGKTMARARQKRGGSLKGHVFKVTKVGEGKEQIWEFDYVGKSKDKEKAKSALKKKPDFEAIYAPMDKKKLKKMIGSMDDDDFANN